MILIKHLNLATIAHIVDLLLSPLSIFTHVMNYKAVFITEWGDTVPFFFVFLLFSCCCSFFCCCCCCCFLGGKILNSIALPPYVIVLEKRGLEQNIKSC